MAKPLLSDELWAVIEPLLPPAPPRCFRHSGRKRKDNRAVLTGIPFVLKNGIQWEDLPQEMGCGCSRPCWRCLKEWQAAGMWHKIHVALLEKLQAADQIDWSRAIVDAGTIRADGAGKKYVPNPADRRKPGSKHHLIFDGQGIPLAAILSAANENEITKLLELVDAIPPLRGGRGGAPNGCRGTGAMTPSRIARRCANVISHRCWPSGARNTAADWASTAGSWSA